MSTTRIKTSLALRTGRGLRLLGAVLLLASIARARESSYRMEPPHIPAPKIVEAVPPPQTHVFAALDVNNAFTGNNTMGKWNSIITVDGTQFTTCDSAVTAAITQAGSGTALVIVPSTYVGADCTIIPTNVKVQVWYFNGTEASGVQSGVYWNNTSTTPIHSWLRLQDNDPSPVGNSLAGYFIHRVTGVIPTASAMDAISPEVQTYGAITSWGATATLQASENVCTVASTGGTISQLFCTVSYGRGAPASTSNVSNLFGFYSPTMVNSGTGVWTNVYGAVFDAQNAGTTNNLSLWAKGSTEFDATNSFICTTSNCKNVTISGTATANGSGCARITNTGGSGHTYDFCEIFGTGRLSIRDTTQTGAPAWSFQQLSTTGGAEGIITHTNTGVRTYTFQDASGTVAFNPPAATGTDLGSTALPWQNFWLGTAATNNFKFQPAATSGARIITMADPLSPTTVGLPFTIASGTTTLTANAALAAVTSQAANTTAATGVLTTDVITWSFATAPTAGDNLCHVLPYVTAGNVNFVRTNPTAAAQNVSALVINWKVVR